MERAERERADEARRAPFACERELRELVRRMLACPSGRAYRILHLDRRDP